MGSGGNAGGASIPGAYTPAPTPWYGDNYLGTTVQSQDNQLLYHSNPAFGPIKIVYGMLPSARIGPQHEYPKLFDARTGAELQTQPPDYYTGCILYLSAVAYVKTQEPGDYLDWDSSMWGAIAAWAAKNAPNVEVNGIQYKYVLHPDIAGRVSVGQQYRLPGWATMQGSTGKSRKSRAVGAATCWSEVETGYGTPCPCLAMGVNDIGGPTFTQWLLHNASWEVAWNSGTPYGKNCYLDAVAASQDFVWRGDYWEGHMAGPETSDKFLTAQLCFGGYREGSVLTSVLGNGPGFAMAGNHKVVRGERKHGAPWVITLACPVMPDAVRATDWAVSRIGR